MSDNVREVKNIRYIGLNGGSPTALLTNDQFVGCLTSEGIVQPILPPISAYGGQFDQVDIYLSDKDGNAGTNKIIITASGGNLINGATSVEITTNYGSGRLYPVSPTDWVFLAGGSAEGSQGTFNTTGISGAIFDLTAENMMQYWGVFVQGASVGTLLGSIFNMISNVLRFWSCIGCIDIVTMNCIGNPRIKNVTWSNSAAALGLMANATYSDNPVLTNILHGVLGGGTLPLANVTISGSPLLKAVFFSPASLTLASVDGVLAYLDSTGVTGGTVNVGGGTSSAPTGGGANPNVLSLIGKGWTVIHN